MKFKSYLRTLKEKRHWSHPLPYGILGRIGNYINTPILNTGGLCDIDDFVQCYEETINGSSVGSIPKSLTDTDLGRNILEELKSTKFSSKYVFCHNALYYKSFVLKDNKLIGIRNWQYAGFYPPEFENIIAKYLDNIF
jgi:thiamine kinase-like enzyme